MFRIVRGLCNYKLQIARIIYIVVVMRKKYKKNFNWAKHFSPLRIIGITVVAVGIIVFCLFGTVSPIDEIVGFNVNRGASVSSVAADLKSKKIIFSQTLFKISVALNGGNIQVGGYDIPARTSVWKIASMMSRGRVATISVLIPEGFTVLQIEKLLNKNESLTGAADCNCNDGDLFPDTYYVAKGSSKNTVLELARKKMNDVKNSFANAKLPKPLKNWNDVMTLASIVQKETPQINEMPVVAGVYLNRLNIRMRLQADPTVVYVITEGLGDMQGRALLRSHLETVSPYNTYTNYGLPPSPIANVGRAAIAAVLQPAQTDYLYFVADGTGGHVFSRTYGEHQQRHQEWRNIRDAL